MNHFFKYFYLYSLLSFIFLINSCDNDSNEEVEIIYTAQITGTSSISEGGATATVNFELDKVNETGSAIQLNYEVGGTASSSVDFAPLSGMVSIVNGQSNASITISINDDEDDESDETIIISLSATGQPSNVKIGTASLLTVVITDNDEQVVACPNDNSISTDFNACTLPSGQSNSYNDATITGSKREIVTNGVPEHAYSNQLSQQGVTISTEIKTYFVNATPSKGSNITSILSNTNRPRYRFGIAKNGVVMDPAPAEPFIFENSNTGEYNWDWVFEPTNNTNEVRLDCAYAHVQPDGTYHYHGDMQAYANQLLDGLGDGTVTPTEAIQIGWSADGYPVYYKFAPNANGDGVEELTSGYVLKTGERPGDGVSAPCGEYSGKYTNDYSWSANQGDLDECNGIDRSVTINGITYNYFYVITDGFPVIPRCLVGTPDDSFRLGGN